MSMGEIEIFAEDIRNACLAGSDTDQERASFEGNFTDEMLGYLEDFSVIEEPVKCYLRKRGIKVNAYWISDERDRLYLFTCLPMPEKGGPLPSVSRTEIDTMFAKALTFYEKCLAGQLEDVDESDDAWEMINDIQALDGGLCSIHIFAVIGGVTRQLEYPSGECKGVPVSYHIWPLERFRKQVESGKTRQVIDVDFEARFGAAIPCLEAPRVLPEIRTFMLVFNGDVLADIYNDYRERLLQKNVRCFLQLRGKVNKGLRDTIHDAPAYFMAYNNGLTMTAEDVTVESRDGALFLTRAVDLQIVNGGQTTASIWSAKYRDQMDVSQVGVQVKLTSMSHSRKMDDLVSDISRYANTQNRVSESDFSSNHPFHRKLEELSRTIWAPAKAGSQVETKWFYERSRGQYMGERSRQGDTRSRAVKTWEISHPRNQMFSKTDLAKYENSWRQLPHLVSLGAQKNFTAFMNDLRKTSAADPNLTYFEELIAKAIMFKTAEKIVGRQKFGGYRAQIVTYTLAKLSHESGQLIDLQTIWEAQELPDALCSAIETTCFYANQLIQVDKPINVSNSGEWAKREKCWHIFREMQIDLDVEFKQTLRNGSKKVMPSKRIVTAMTPEEEELINWLVGTMPDLWEQLYEWAKDTGNFPGRTRNMFISMKKGAEKKVWEPSPKQARFARDLYTQAIALGFTTQN